MTERTTRPPAPRRTPAAAPKTTTSKAAPPRREHDALEFHRIESSTPDGRVSIEYLVRVVSCAKESKRERSLAAVGIRTPAEYPLFVEGLKVYMDDEAYLDDAAQGGLSFARTNVGAIDVITNVLEGASKGHWALARRLISMNQEEPLCGGILLAFKKNNAGKRLCERFLDHLARVTSRGPCVRVEGLPAALVEAVRDDSGEESEGTGPDE